MGNKEYEYADFGKHIRNQRKLKYSDMKAFSQATSISIKDLYGYECGRTFPPIEKFISICQALDRTPTYMMIPLYDMQKEEQDLIQFFYENDLREILKDPEVRTILTFALSCLQLLYHTRKHSNTKSNIIDDLHSLKDKLFREGNFKKLK
jgi:transcriptional regulator with XRE-family HTH domain